MSTDPAPPADVEREPPPNLRKIVLIVLAMLLPLIALFIYVGAAGVHGS